MGFDDVVFDERVRGPAIDGEVAIAFGGEGTGVDDFSEDWLVVRWRGELMMGGWGRYLLLPVFQPLPMTKLPLSPDHFTLNLPSGPLFWVILALPSVQDDQK